ncbi:MAG: hypothetical protein V1746_02170 [bacterium]
MRAYEIWGELSPSLNHAVLEAAYVHQKKLYRNLVQDAAQHLHQRPQRLLETPRNERHAQFQPLLASPAFYMLSQNLLLNWLLQSESAMMAAFLDALRIAHDGQGCASDFPEKIDDTLLTDAVAKLYEKFDAEKIRFYLKTFDSVAGVNWPSLQKLIR